MFSSYPIIQPRLYNTTNFSSPYKSSVPKALPIIPNTTYSHANVTIAPPIPSYYRTNINASYSQLPNVMGVTYTSPGRLAQSYSEHLNKLQNLENRLNKRGSDQDVIDEVSREEKAFDDYEMKEKLQKQSFQKLTNSKDVDNFKETFEKIKETNPKIPDYQTTKKEKQILNQELMSKKGIEAFNAQLISSLAEYSNGIQKQIQASNQSANYYEVIKNNLQSIKNDLGKRIDNFNKQSMNAMKDIRTIMTLAPKSRLKLLSNNVFPDIELNKDINFGDSEEDENDGLETLNAAIKREADKKGELNKKLNEEMNANINNNLNLGFNFGLNKNNREDEVRLDLWEKNRREDLRTYRKIAVKVDFMGRHNFEMKPINKFRSYVYTVMAARRLLNIQHLTFKYFKYESVLYFIEHYEDMDIILKKLVYNSIREPFLDLLNNDPVVLNMILPNDNTHNIFILLMEYVNRLLQALQNNFFDGVSNDMLNYLSLFITNYSFIPKDFFTTFELARFRTNPVGDFVDLDDDIRVMILTFYIIIKIFLRNILLELMFNQTNIDKVGKNTKLNIKMIVSILYRGVIKKLKSRCVTRTNLEDIEESEDMTQFLKVNYNKKEFRLDQFLRKRYYLKASEVFNEKGKRISNRQNDYREKDYIKGNIRSVRETRKNKSKRNKRIDEIEKGKKRKLKEQELLEKIKQGGDSSSSGGSESENKSDSKSSSTDRRKRKKKSKKNTRDEESSTSKTHTNSRRSKETSSKQGIINTNTKKRGMIQEDSEDRKSSSSGGRAPPKYNNDVPKEPNNSSIDSISSFTPTESKKSTNPKNNKKKKRQESKSVSSKSSKNQSSTNKNQKKKKKKKKKEHTNSKNDYFPNEEEYKEEMRKFRMQRQLALMSEEKKKLLPRRKFSDKKVEGRIKEALLNLNKNYEYELQENDLKKKKDTIKEFSQSDIENMFYIIENLQSYGDDIDPNEVDLLDAVLYDEDSLETYYLYADEYSFDPAESLIFFIENLLEHIVNCFNSPKIKFERRKEEKKIEQKIDKDLENNVNLEVENLENKENSKKTKSILKKKIN